MYLIIIKCIFDSTNILLPRLFFIFYCYFEISTISMCMRLKYLVLNTHIKYVIYFGQTVKVILSCRFIICSTEAAYKNHYVFIGYSDFL
jgi:hypothetical protein